MLSLLVPVHVTNLPNVNAIQIWLNLTSIVANLTFKGHPRSKVIIVLAFVPLIALILPYLPHSPHIYYNSIETASLCKILEQSDHYSLGYCISKIWGIQVSSANAVWLLI